MALGDKLLNKVVIFFSFAENGLDYFTDVFPTFLDLDHVNYIAVYGRVRELSECIKIS